MKLYVALTVGMAAMAMAAKGDKKAKPGLTVDKFIRMPKKKMVKTINKAQKDAEKAINKSKKQMASYGLKFDEDEISKILDNIVNSQVTRGLNQWKQTEAKIAAKASAISAANNQRKVVAQNKVNEFQAKRSEYGVKRLESVRRENQDAVQAKIDTIENQNLKDLASSVFSSVAAGLTKNFNKFVPAGLTVEDAAKQVFESAANMAMNSDIVAQNKAKVEKIKNMLVYRCARFAGGKKACANDVADAQKKANEFIQKVGLDNAYEWSEKEAAKFQALV